MLKILQSINDCVSLLYVLRIMIKNSIIYFSDDSERTQPYYDSQKQKLESKYQKRVEELEEKHSREMQAIQSRLQLVEEKKQYLENELAETTKAKEDASESCLKAKQEVLQNFGDLMETELQCSICNELFVTRRGRYNKVSDECRSRILSEAENGGGRS
ncbi:hypothetical protein C0J52_18809 [Blattella germanica]|nr:hypothetical protein C0J52_18809 [Blattella germanica]